MTAAHTAPAQVPAPNYNADKRLSRTILSASGFLSGRVLRKRWEAAHVGPEHVADIECAAVRQRESSGSAVLQVGSFILFLDPYADSNGSSNGQHVSLEAGRDESFRSPHFRPPMDDSPV